MMRIITHGRGWIRALTRVFRLLAGISGGALRWRCEADGSGRAEWLHRLCRHLSPIFGLESLITGSMPRRGLLVANHLSYLDVVFLASLAPCVFVAKSEVRGWPVFGWFARMAGTIFVKRNSRVSTGAATAQIQAALRRGALVVLFAEGTSSNGSTVLPFKSSLLQAAIGERVPICVAALRYDLDDGDPSTEACYWGNHTLVVHLLNLMAKRGVKAFARFREVSNTWRDRKRLAVQLHAAVLTLHGSIKCDLRRPARQRSESGFRRRMTVQRALQVITAE